MAQRLYALFITVVAVVFISTPFFFTPAVNAQGFLPGDKSSSGIVPCGDVGEQACNFCDLVKLADNSLSFAVYFSVFVATLLFAYAGFLYVTAVGDTGKISTATGIFGKVVVGMIIVLTAWLVVDTVMKTFFDNSDLAENFGPWNDIKCAARVNTENNKSAKEQRKKSGTGDVEVIKNTIGQPAARARLTTQDTVKTSIFDTSKTSIARSIERDCSIVGGKYVETCKPRAGLACGVTIHSCSGYKPSYIFEVRRFSDGTYETSQVFSSLDQCKKEAKKVDSKYGQVVRSCSGVDYEKQ